MFPFVHVIERSAFEKMQFERDSLQLKLSMLELNREMEAITNTKSIFRGEKIVQLLEACEQERDRYRAALEEITKVSTWNDTDAYRMDEVAREALNKAAVIKGE